VIIIFTGGNWKIVQVNNIIGTKITQGSTSAIIPTSHPALSSLDWLNSGHIGTANTIPAFNSVGVAKEIAP